MIRETFVVGQFTTENHGDVHCLRRLEIKILGFDPRLRGQVSGDYLGHVTVPAYS